MSSPVANSFAKVSSDFREEWGMEFHEFELLSRRFLSEYREALARWNAGERDARLSGGDGAHAAA